MLLPPLIMSNFQRNYSRTDFDQTHMFTQSVIYDLPFGPGKKFLKSGVLSQVLGGWRVTGVLSLDSGLPLNFGCTCQPINTPNNSAIAQYQRAIHEAVRDSHESVV